jgi:hypothetical protein
MVHKQIGTWTSIKPGAMNARLIWFLGWLITGLAKQVKFLSQFIRPWSAVGRTAEITNEAWPQTRQLRMNTNHGGKGIEFVFIRVHSRLKNLTCLVRV